jgi:hypothetical protein
MQQEENEFIPEDGEIDHRQCSENHSGSLYMKVSKAAQLWERPILRKM